MTDDQIFGPGTTHVAKALFGNKHKPKQAVGPTYRPLMRLRVTDERQVATRGIELLVDVPVQGPMSDDQFKAMVDRLAWALLKTYALNDEGGWATLARAIHGDPPRGA